MMLKWLSVNFRWKIISLIMAVLVWLYISNELSYQSISSEDFRRRVRNPQTGVLLYDETRR